MRGLGTSFWRLFCAASASSVADGLVRVAMPLLAATLTRNPVLVATVTTMTFLPWLLFGLVAGALVDRNDRRRAMAVACFLRAALLAVLGVAVTVGVGNLPLLYAVVFLLGTVNAVADTAARAALPQVVRADQLERGNSLISAQEVVGESFLGAPIGALLFAVALVAPIAGAAAGYVAAAALVLAVGSGLRPAGAGTATSIGADIRTGVRWLVRHRMLRDLTAITAVMAFGLYLTYAVLVLYVLETLGLQSSAYGVVMAVAAVGALVGGLTAPWLKQRLGRRHSLVGSALLSAAATGAMGLTGAPVLAVALFTVAAFAGTVWDVVSVSLRQAYVPDALLGRVQGAYRMTVWGAMPLGAAAGGALAAAAGVPAVFLTGGLVNLLATALLWTSLRRHRDELDPSAASVPA